MILGAMTMNNDNYPSRAEFRKSNAKKQPTKKRFYKRWWFWLIVIVLLGGAGGFGGYTAFKANSTTTTKTTKKKTVAKKKTAKKAGVTLKQYNGIYLSQNDGLSSVTLQQLLGRPSESTTSTVQDLKTSVLTWNQVADGELGSKLSVNFASDHAISKTISGLKVKRPQKLGLSQYNTIQNGTSEDELLSSLGKPNGYSETAINGTTAKSFTYSSGIKGKVGANFVVTLTNGTVSAKSQTGLE